MSNWQRLSQELDLWSESGRTATLWWRDDDAVAPTPQLERLLKHTHSVPLSLAVVPSAATPELAERIRGLSSIAILQHGWAHANHAAAGLSEYPSSRSEADVGSELAAGRDVLNELFGAQSIAAFVPPFHGFDDRFLRLLPQNGIASISRKGPRPSRFAAKGLLQVNAHVSPIRWTAPPSFGDDAPYLAELVDHLCGRRTGRYDSAEPTGLLTHHLWQDEGSFEFVSRLVDLTLQHPAAKWLHGTKVFFPDQGSEAWSGHSVSNPIL
jgi:hypothetical protein